MSDNRRKNVLNTISIGPTAVNGTTVGFPAAANADRVVFFIEVLDVAAGSITFKIQISPENIGFCDLTTAEMTGNTGAIAATGSYHISADVPLGMSVRLAYTIVTGPVDFEVVPVFEKTGKVY